MHPPSVALGRVMEAAGVEAGFSGTSGVVGSYAGLADVGGGDPVGMPDGGGLDRPGGQFPHHHGR